MSAELKKSRFGELNLSGQFDVKGLVLGQGGNERDFMCKGSDGLLYRIDLITDGSLPRKFIDNPPLLVGKSITIGWSTTYVSIANEIEIS